MKENVMNAILDKGLVTKNYVYPESVNELDNGSVFMISGKEDDLLVVTGELSNDFIGTELLVDGEKVKVCEKTHANAEALRKNVSWTAPIPVLGMERSVGVGDRLGIACPGHIRVFKDYDAYPVFAQQSIRELNLTNRTYEDVLDCVSFSVLRDGYKDGFGADGDHLKKPEEVEYALSLGYTMITLDCSEHIRNDVDAMSEAEVEKLVTLSDDLKNTYLGKTFDLEGEKVTFTEDALRRNVLIYGDAINFAISIYNKYIKGGKVSFEISIDETMTPTLPTQHYFVANELTKAGVKFDTVAPRFCGEFQKGVDYIGDLVQFEKELKVHAAIARHFGYKLSIHSGSDKFSTFELIGKYTKGNFHLKTAGTNWLEAMRAVSQANPSLYRRVHAYALEKFEEAKKFYHVTTDLTKIPDLATLKDEELPELFKQNDARQLIHITYGFILTEKKEDGSFLFRDELYKFWRENEQVYSDALYKHIGRHLELLYKGFAK